MPVETIDRLAHELDAEAKAVSADVDRFFGQLLAPTGDSRERFYEAMRHAAIGGGKRLRPLLTIAASRLFAIARERALRVGSAIEAIHVYSLIHDDLPCMDDAELRRGKVTVHKAYGEAVAVLAATACTPSRSRSSPARPLTTIRGFGPTWCWSWPGRPARREWPAGR